MTTTKNRVVRTAAIFLGSLAIVLVASASQAQNQSGVWVNTAASGNATLWSVQNNWLNNLVANGAGFTADFSTLNITADSTVNLDSSRTIGNLIFGDATTVSNDWTLANNGTGTTQGVGNILTLDNTGGTGAPKITVKNSGVTISAELDGTQGVILTSTTAGVGANLVLSGPNNYSGGTTINSLSGGSNFTVFAANATAFGTGDVHFNPGTSNFGRMVFGNGLTYNNNIYLDTINGTTGGNGAILTGVLTAFTGTTTTINGDTSATINGTIFVNAKTLSGGTFAGSQPSNIGTNGNQALTNNYLTLAGPIIVNNNLPGMAIVAKNINGGSMTGVLHRAGNVRYSNAGSNFYRLEVRSGIAQVGIDNGMGNGVGYVELGGNSNVNPAAYGILDLNGHLQTLTGLSNYLGSSVNTPTNPATVMNSSTTTAATLVLAPKPASDINGQLWFTAGLTGTGTNAILTNVSPNAPLNIVVNGDPTGIQYLTAPRSGYTGSTTLTSGTLAINSVADGGLTHTLTTAVGSQTATVDDATGLLVGQVVTGPGLRNFTMNGNGPGGIGANTPFTISAINGTTITLNQQATAAGANLTAFGAGNGLGISSSAASNLVFNGGTLAYVGNAKDLNNATVFLNGTSLIPSTNRNFTINTSGTIDVENSFNTTNSTTSVISLTMSGGSANTNGILNKTGPGILILTGTNQHTGNTNVNAGTLLVNGSGSLSTGAVGVASLATLGGSGTIGGTVTPASGGIIAPGDPATASGVGTLTLGGLTLNPGSRLNLELSNTSTLDKIAIGAAGATFNGGSIFLYQPGTTTDFVSPAGSNSYPLFTVTGGITGSANNLTIANPQGGKFYSFSGTTTINLTIGDATTVNWNGSSSNSWATGANWVGGSVPNAVGTSVRFDQQNLSGSSNTTITLNGGKTASGILFNDQSSGGTSFTIQGVDTLTLNNGVAAAGITVANGSQIISAPITATNSTAVSLGNSGSSLTLSGIFSGGKPLTISGSGTLNLTNNNSYSTTALSAATLNIGTFGGSDAAGTLGSGDITTSNGATLNFNRGNSYSFPGGISGSGVGAGSVNQLGTGSTTVTGPISNVTTVNVSAGTLTASSSLGQSGGINVTGAGSLTVGGSITGGGGLNVNTTGTVNLNGSNGYGGNTTIDGGTVILNAAGALPANSVLRVNGGTLDLHGNNISLSNITETQAGGTITNNGPANSTSTIAFFGALEANYNIWSALNDGTGKVAISTAITNLNTNGVGPRIVEFHSPGTYTGGTTVNSQSIQADANNAFGTGPITVTLNNGSTNWSQIFIQQGVSIQNDITIQQGRPVPGTGANSGVIQTTAGSGNATVAGSVTILANNSNGGLFFGPLAGGADYLNINGPVTASGTATTIIQMGGNVRYFGGGSYPIMQINGVAQLGANNALAQNAALQFSVATTGTASNGTLDLAGKDQTVVSLAATSANTSTIQNSGAGPNTLTLNTTGTTNYNGMITGPINLVVGGSGTQQLTGISSDYTGVTTLTGSAVVEAAAINPGGSAGSIGGASNAASNLVFDGGALRYTGATSSTDRGFTINSGKTAKIDVATAATNLTWSGSSGASSGGLTKLGPGTLTIDAAATHGYTGPTAVSAGTLVVNNALTSTSSISIASGAFLTGSGSIGGTFNHTAGTINPGVIGGVSAGTLTFTGPITLNGGIVQYDVDGSQLATFSAQDLVKANGGLTVAGPTTIDLEFLNPTPPSSAFDYRLFSYTGTAPTLASLTSNLSFVTNVAGRNTYTPSASGGFVTVHVVPGVSANLNWNSTSSGAWDVNTTANWFNTGTSAQEKFQNGDNVTFADGASLQTAITLNGTVNPNSVAVTSNTNNYTISGTGKISGLGNLTKSGNSTLTLKTNNDYSGTTTISAGTINVGGGTNSGSLGTGAVTNNGTLALSRTDGTALTPLVIPNDISGPGTLTLSLNGTANLTAGVISQGSIIANGLGTTKLTGSVNTTGNVTISSGSINIPNSGSLNVGGSIAVSGTGDLTMDGSATAAGGLTLSNTATAMLSGGLNGAGGITMNSTNFVTIGGSSNYGGNTIINSGTFFTNNASALGDTTGTTTVNSPGSLFLVAQLADYGNEQVTINGSGTANNGALHAGGSTTSTLQSPLTLGSSSLINVDGGATLNLNSTTGPTATGSNVTLTVSGGGTLLIRGAPNLGAGGTIALTVSGGNPAGNLAFGPQVGESISVSAPITGTGTLTATGGGTVTLTGNNTYSGATAVNAGTILSVSSLNRVLGGSPSSNLGAPTTAANGRIGLGGSAGSGTLRYTGSGETTDRSINLAGGTAGSGVGIIEQAGTGLLKFTSNMETTAGDGVPKTLTLQGSNTGTGEFAGVIGDRSATTTTSVAKNGTGRWTLSGVNTYTGSTTVNGGSLILGVANSISTTSLVTLSGGTLGTGGLNQNLTLGTVPAPLNVAANSAIDLGSGSSTLTFADSSGQGWGGNLNIVHWNNGLDHVVFGNSSSALNGTELGQISFATYAPGVNISASGEITPASLTRVLTHGDWSLDGVLNLADVPAALSALTDLNKYMTDNGLTSGQLATIGDYNGGGVTNTDIQPLLDDVALHGSGSVAAVPEPGSLALLAIGLAAGIPLLRSARRRKNHR